MSKRVAILVGGGDVPGLNMCLKSLVYRTIDAGFEPIGVRKGWEGLIRYNYHDPTTYGDNFIELSKNMVRPIDRTPGSFLHASRVDPSQTPRRLVPEFLRRGNADSQDLTGHIKEVVQRLGFHALIVLGDDDMLRCAAQLSREGTPIIAIPKTVHNNIHGTDYTIGFSTGLARGVAFIHELRALAGSREQVVVVETFGANSGLSSLMTAFLAGADRAIIPEVPYDPERLAYLVMRDKSVTPGNYAVVTVSDGSRIVPEKLLQYTPHLSPRSKSEVLKLLTADKAKEIKAKEDFILDEVVETGSSLAGSGMVAAELLQHLMGEEVFMQPLTYLLRTGSPDGQDLLGATNFAILATQLLSQGKFGRMTAYQQRYNLMDVDLQIVTQGVNGVDVEEMYDLDNYRPKVNLIWAAQEKG
ncbi:MAG: phosphofructokinase [Anaerolineae bacterium]|nr:6-phosphofructokinase [Anaerolineales bacterium]MCQ3977400.1 phosphofructokinase [Anaerolineae bacterium]